ncbi:hypothetical protein BTH42_33875 [Burkholderia sp. SRS-W-2-2016]|uniref:hypothetical protein n=1 Tax=Burkholderia sp. SRS-W-2-2016 TaxID=1926878 RepID=UPI00094AF8C2|nr:hypothetical protein [Burkholderia sp. SRS-W-2-2016]OLL27234.1 hypothetical protein BTH42_33875 [Burkholderia sp. SRS-W-2-2016]
MNRLSKTLTAVALCACAIGNASAAAPAQQIDVSFYKDGHLVSAGTSIIAHEAFGRSPFAYSSGTHVGFGTCHLEGATMRLQSESRFVGLSLVVKPVDVDTNKARLSVTAQDTEFVGKRDSGTVDCHSEVVDVKGLEATDVTIDVVDGQSVDVPLGDARYRLVLKLHRADL